MMRLLIISRRFPPDVFSGSETVIARLWEMAREHYETFLCCGWHRARDLVPKEALSVDLSKTSGLRKHLKFFRHCHQAIRTVKPDVILLNTMGLYPSMVPICFLIHDFNFGRSHGEQRLSFARKWLIRWNIQQAKRVIAVSEFTKNRIAELWPAENKTAVIPNGVDLLRFSKSDLGRKDRRFHIVYPSRILEGKGQHIAIEAFKKLDRKVQEHATLTIVGAVHDQDYLKALQRLAIGHDIEFFPDVEDIVPYYQMADVVVFPTFMEEGFGYTAVEAMACGKPVIHSAQPAIREATGGIGLSFAPGNSSQLAAAIEKLRHDQRLREQIGSAGRQFVESERSWSAAFVRYREIIEDVCTNER